MKIFVLYHPEMGYLKCRGAKAEFTTELNKANRYSQRSHAVRSLEAALRFGKSIPYLGVVVVELEAIHGVG